MWRFGSEGPSNIPIRCLRSAAFRRKYIDWYSNLAWRKWQKQLLHRYCSLVSILLQGLYPALSDTENCEPLGEEWDLAIEAFKRKWPKMPSTKITKFESRKWVTKKSKVCRPETCENQSSGAIDFRLNLRKCWRWLLKCTLIDILIIHRLLCWSNNSNFTIPLKLINIKLINI